jgi:hypothetical protein
MVTGAVASVGQPLEERRPLDVLPRAFSSREAMVKELKTSQPGDRAVLHVVDNASDWDAGWVEDALRVRTVRDGRVRVLFVGGPEHALAWVLNPKSAQLTRELKVLPLQNWSTTLTDHMLQQEHLDPIQFRTALRAATGGYNHLMRELFPIGSNVTHRTFTTRLQAATAKRKRDDGLKADLGLIDPMLDVFSAIAAYTEDVITPYEIGEGPLAELGSSLTGQNVVEFGILMGLLESQGGSADAEDVRPFRLNPLVNTAFENGTAS